MGIDCKGQPVLTVLFGWLFFSRLAYLSRMHLEAFREFCLSLPATTESLPFGPENLVFKVAGKIFAIADAETFASINLKCDPDEAIEQRERFSAVQPGYHMSKKHWNTIVMDGSIPFDTIAAWTKNSYDLVVLSLPKKLREANGL
jgi:predicted DNA-binding protein (MmcQ/YjbR family)